MQKKLINPYKIQKKLKRGMKKNILRSMVTRNDLPHEKDFTWRKKETNPFRYYEVSWRKRWYLIMGIFAFIGTLAIGFYHPFFQVHKISVAGLQRISENDFTESINGIIDYKKFFFLPGRSYFLVDVEEIHDILMQKYPLSTLIVKKEFPDKLSFVLEEKISTVIYDNGNQYSYIGLDGKLVETIRNVGAEEWHEVKQMVTSTSETGEEIQEEKVIERYHTPAVTAVKAEMGDYPIVYDTRGKEMKVNDVALEDSTVTAIIEWFNYLRKRAQIPFSYIVLENEFRDATIYTDEGWYLQVKLTGNLQEQFDALDYILKEKVNRGDIRYIDLRYGNKIYWQ